MALSPSLAPGARIDGKYVVVRTIGAGAMGVVYEATQERLGRRVALKVVMAAEDDDARARFLDEARAAARINHRNSIALHDVGRLPDGRPYLVMEYLSGETLSALRTRGALDATEAVSRCRDVAGALADAHQVDVVHCDVKPENVLVADMAGERVTKLLDFGVSKTAPSGAGADLTMRPNIAGTLKYMAPERLLGRATLASSDIFSLGVMLYRLISGRFPFEAATDAAYLTAVIDNQIVPLRERVVGLPPVIDNAIMEALSSRPPLRPTARELEKLLLVQSGFQVQARQPGITPTSQRQEPAPRASGEANDEEPTRSVKRP